MKNIKLLSFIIILISLLGMSQNTYAAEETYKSLIKDENLATLVASKFGAKASDVISPIAKVKPIEVGKPNFVSNNEVKSIEGLSNFNVVYLDLWAKNKWQNEDLVINELNKMNSLKTLIINGKFSKLPSLSQGNNVEILRCHFCELTSIPNGNYSKIKELNISQEDNFTKEVTMNIDFTKLPVLNDVILQYEGTVGNLFENSTLNEVLLRRINDKEILTKEIKSSNINKLTIEDTPSLKKIGNQIGKLPLKEIVLNGSLNLDYVSPEIYKSNLNYLFFQNLGLKKLDKNMAKLMDVKQVELYMLQEVEEIDKEALPLLKKANATLPITPFQELNVNSIGQEVVINANDFVSNLKFYDKSAKLQFSLDYKDVTGKIKNEKGKFIIPLYLFTQKDSTFQVRMDLKGSNGVNIFNYAEATYNINLLNFGATKPEQPKPEQPSKPQQPSKPKPPAKPNCSTYKKGYTTTYRTVYGKGCRTTKTIYKKGSTTTTTYYKLVKGKTKMYKKQTYVKYKKRNVRTYYNTISYFSNGRVHHNTKLYKDKKTNKYTKRNKTSYHSSGKKYYYVSFSYKKGKTTSRTEYRYNKAGQTKSNNHGKAYKYKTSYKKGKAKKTIRQQYNKKGKLLKAKKVAKRNFL